MGYSESESPATSAGSHKKEKPWSHPDRAWEVKDAMHTLMRAGEHARDKGLMKEVKKHAAEHAAKMKEVSHQAEALAKSGKISPAQMEKLGKGKY